MKRRSAPADEVVVDDVVVDEKPGLDELHRRARPDRRKAGLAAGRGVARHDHAGPQHLARPDEDAQPSGRVRAPGVDRAVTANGPGQVGFQEGGYV